jgi:hypothetical protein
MPVDTRREAGLDNKGYGEVHTGSPFPTRKGKGRRLSAGSASSNKGMMGSKSDGHTAPGSSPTSMMAGTGVSVLDTGDGSLLSTESQNQQSEDAPKQVREEGYSTVKRWVLHWSNQDFAEIRSSAKTAVWWEGKGRLKLRLQWMQKLFEQL